MISLEKIIADQGVKSVRYVTAVTPEQAQGLVAEVYEQVKREYVLAPPLMLHSPAPQVLAAVWCSLRESFLFGQVPRHYKEAISAAVAVTNRCPYCIDAHSAALYGLSAPGVAEAIDRGELNKIKDKRLRDLLAWAPATRSPGAEVLCNPPFTAQETSEIIGTVVGFHYTNRMVNIFLNDSVLPLPSSLGMLRGALRRMTGSLLRKQFRAPASSRQLNDSFPDTTLPHDLSWAEATPAQTVAWARLNAAMEQAGRDVLSDAVCNLVLEHLDSWQGEDPGLSRAWVERAVIGLDESAKPAARLTLLTALASYQVDDGVIDAFRANVPSDESLIKATAWASYVAARRVGSWLKEPTSVLHNGGDGFEPRGRGNNSVILGVG
jgi:AhpD family alkylhydroperoxidase